jgi:asparagine synthase (glutamine-hydrolysing)
MCGICGEFITSISSAYHPQISAELISRMSQRMAHRGPDAQGIFQQQPTPHSALSFGHRRLSIIDLSEKSTQPMLLPEDSTHSQHSDQNRWALVFNGCIYNYRELRQELSKLGAIFNSTSDTEVILHAWQHWGEKCVEKLDGMFAFAIWDTKQKALYLVRDRFGIKPMYYTIQQTKQGMALRFSSTLPSLLECPEISHQLNSQALHFMYHLHAVTPAPHTILKSIKKLPPASFLKISQQQSLDENIQPQRYWHLPPQHQINIPKQSLEDWQKQSEELLLQAVKKRLLAADVPVGILLSGGLDSSLIVALADKLHQQGEWQQKLHTYSIGFEDIGDEKGSEFYYSDQVVKQFQTQHHRYQIPNDDVLKRLPEAIEAMSEPMFGQDCIAFYLLSEQVAKHTKVVLSGQGADEVFAGYFWFQQIYKQQQQATNNFTVSSAYEQIANYYIDRTHNEWQTMIQPQWHGEDFTAQWFKKQLSLSENNNVTAELLRIDATSLIVDDPVKRVDNMTMAWSLEARVPFLDTQLVEHANQIPVEHRLMHNGKGVLKNIAKSWFSDDFIFRKKGYFPMPALKYVRGEFLEKMSDTLTATQARQRGIFQPKYIDNLLKNPEQNLTRLQGSKLWHCALLEWWLQSNNIK